MAQFPDSIQLEDLDGHNGFAIYGEAGQGQIGRSVSTAGDLNGDGFEDVVVGAPNGGAYVVYGKASGFDAGLELSDLNGQNGFQIHAVSTELRTGYSVASAGDVNGDGIDDLFIGANSANFAFPGTGYVVFGSKTSFGADFDLSDLDGHNGFAVEGAGGDDTGFSVSSAGDVNGDGVDDIIIGKLAGATNGKSYVVFGHSGPFDGTIDLTGLDGNDGFAITGGIYNGYDVSSAGDINGDGVDDIVIGGGVRGANDGISYVVFGTSSGFGATVSLASLDGNNGFSLTGDHYSAFGHSVSSAGDINGDGFEDIIIGSPQADPGGDDNGEAYVLFGSADGFDATIDASSLDGNNGFRIPGNFSSFAGKLGWSVSAAGDANGDGFDDIIMGAWNSNRAFVIFGKAAGWTPTFNLSFNGNNGFSMDGVSVGDYAGRSVSAADVNGDGFSDVIVGADGANSPTHAYVGATYVVLGIAPTTRVHRVGTVASQTLAGGDFNDTLKGLGGDDELFGNGGKDNLKGGVGDDMLHGGRGADNLAGGSGSDTFVYLRANESTHVYFDTIVHFDFDNMDRFDLASQVTGNDPTVSGALSEASFDTDLAAAVDGGHLGAKHAVLFTVDGGDFDGETFLVIDTNNLAGYQAGKDIVIHLDDARHVGAIDVSDFI